MPKDKKIALLDVLDCLKKYTDDTHHLTAEKLVELLCDREISIDRKTIYRIINSLIEYGIDINNTKIPHSGYFIAQRDFEMPEVRLLVDAALTAPFITEKKTKELTDKLYNLISVYQAEQIQNQIYYEKRIKFNNEEIYYVIDTINQAIINDRKISFIYNHKTLVNNKITLDKGKQFVVSPYALMWSNDRYYLAGSNDRFNNITNYRLDRMRKITTTDENRRAVNEVSQFVKEFDTAAYIKKNINMFSGKPSTITLNCDISILDLVIDRFGEDCKFTTSKDTEAFQMTTNFYISEGLIDWILVHTDKLEVISPISLRNSVKDKLSQLCKCNYK